MGEARELMDRATAAIMAKDDAAVAACYAPDVVATTPDQGTLHGIEQLKDYMRELTDAFPDMSYELSRGMEDGKYAIDEGYVVGTNTGPLTLPDGRRLPATGKTLRMRSMDVATVESGLITKHDFYFDQMEMIDQLGLMQALTTAG